MEASRGRLARLHRERLLVSQEAAALSARLAAARARVARARDAHSPKTGATITPKPTSVSIATTLSPSPQPCPSPGVARCRPDAPPPSGPGHPRRRPRPGPQESDAIPASPKQSSPAAHGGDDRNEDENEAVAVEDDPDADIASDGRASGSESDNKSESGSGSEAEASGSAYSEGSADEAEWDGDGVGPPLPEVAVQANHAAAAAAGGNIRSLAAVKPQLLEAGLKVSAAVGERLGMRAKIDCGQLFDAVASMDVGKTAELVAMGGSYAANALDRRGVGTPTTDTDTAAIRRRHHFHHPSHIPTPPLPTPPSPTHSPHTPRSAQAPRNVDLCRQCSSVPEGPEPTLNHGRNQSPPPIPLCTVHAPGTPHTPCTPCAPPRSYPGKVPVLYSAVEPGNSGCIRELLKGNARTDAEIPICRWTALHRAAACGDSETARLLISESASKELPPHPARGGGGNELKCDFASARGGWERSPQHHMHNVTPEPTVPMPASAVQLHGR